jgi:hypothetical protein
VPIVLQLRAESANVPVDDVALDDEVGAPQSVEDLLASEHVPGVGGEEVQQRLLERGEVQLVISGEDLSVEHVDLEIADAEARDELSGTAVGPADHRPCAGDQIVWNERNTDVVVSTPLERIKLPAKVVAPRQRE